MIYQNILTFQMHKGIDILDITADINREIKNSKINTGIANIFILGSTGSVTTIEYEQGVVNDLKKAINKLAPENEFYEHELAWHDGNGHSHVQAAIMKPSLIVPIKNNSLLLGTWQQIVIINHDNKARIRKIALTILGESV